MGLLGPGDSVGVHDSLDYPRDTDAFLVGVKRPSFLAIQFKTGAAQAPLVAPGNPFVSEWFPALLHIYGPHGEHIQTFQVDQPAGLLIATPEVQGPLYVVIEPLIEVLYGEYHLKTTAL